jgi:simple sugar transport system ATP-binding protein
MNGAPTTRELDDTRTREPASERLSLSGITKAFPGVIANQDISLVIRPGEVHAILGENGAGKSTLVKILYGFYQPDSGSIRADGREVKVHSPADAKRLGIGMVFQQFMLAPALNVLENVTLALSDVPFVLPRAKIAARVRDLSERYGFQLDPHTPVGSLSVGEQQKVEILKLLIAEASVLIFDEPTSVLAPHESDALMEVFRGLRRDGLSVLFITHKLREVLAVADVITVLRRGRVTASLPRSESVSEASLVGLMLGGTDPIPTGSPVSAAVLPQADTSAQGPIVEVEHAHVPDPAGRLDLEDISLTIRPGEIVGTAAVAGNGQKELGDLLLGMSQARTGTLRVFGTQKKHWTPAELLELGFGCVPEDPLRMGAVSGMSGLENMVLADRRRYSRWRGLNMRWAAAREFAVRALQQFGLGAPALDKPIGQLSGGNIQRVVFARELARKPKLLVSFYPTHGMDVPSANAARQVLRNHRSTGGAVLLVSEDLEELFSLSDRLLVMHHGKIVATTTPADITQHEVGLLMTGAGGSPGGSQHG